MHLRQIGEILLLDQGYRGKLLQMSKESKFFHFWLIPLTCSLWNLHVLVLLSAVSMALMTSGAKSHSVVHFMTGVILSIGCLVFAFSIFRGKTWEFVIVCTTLIALVLFFVLDKILPNVE